MATRFRGVALLVALSSYVPLTSTDCQPQCSRSCIELNGALEQECGDCVRETSGCYPGAHDFDTWKERSTSAHIAEHYHYGRPSVVYGALWKHWPRIRTRWVDDRWLVRKAPFLPLDVEVGASRETRRHQLVVASLRRFVAIYRTLEVYAVTALAPTDALGHEVGSAAWLGGNPHSMSLWWAAVPTQSVLHRDTRDNMLCVVTGQKHVAMLPPHVAPLLTNHSCGWIIAPPFTGATNATGNQSPAGVVHAASEPSPPHSSGSHATTQRGHVNGGDSEWRLKQDLRARHREQFGYGQFAPAHVPADERPCARTLPWVHLRIAEGDCGHIPVGWFHQVESQLGRHGRTLAFNVWYDPPPSSFQSAPAPHDFRTAFGDFRVVCQEFCREPCAVLSGDTRMECNDCVAPFQCRPGAPGYGAPPSRQSQRAPTLKRAFKVRRTVPVSV